MVKFAQTGGLLCLQSEGIYSLCFSLKNNQQIDFRVKTTTRRETVTDRE